jgi:hypothetical protein
MPAALVCALFNIPAGAAEGYLAATYTRQLAPPMVATADSAAIWNNFANTYLERAGEDSAVIDTAIFYYRKARLKAPDDGGIALNLAIAYLLQGKDGIADSLFRVGYAQSDSSLEKVYSLLGMDFEETPQDKGTAGSITEAELRERIAASADSKKKKKNEKPPKSKTKKPAPKPKPTRPGGSKSLDPREVRNYLYWKR